MGWLQDRRNRRRLADEATLHIAALMRDSGRLYRSGTDAEGRYVRSFDAGQELMRTVHDILEIADGDCRRIVSAWDRDPDFERLRRTFMARKLVGHDAYVYGYLASLAQIAAAECRKTVDSTR